jgi:radical SAM superfamily enzyme YgiQ (UPF0313 family)
MAHWQDRLGVRAFIFRDPVFGLNRAQTLSICDEIERSGREFEFLIETHLKVLDKELAARLPEVGLRMVYVGLESVDAGVLETIRRFSGSLDEQRRRIMDLHDLGLEVKTMFFFGADGDTVESCRASIDFAVGLDTAYAHFGVFTPYPGTPAFSEFEPRIVADRYEAFTQWHLVFRHGNLSPKQIRNLLDEAWGRFYARPSWLGRYLARRLFG